LRKALQKGSRRTPINRFGGGTKEKAEPTGGSGQKAKQRETKITPGCGYFAGEEAQKDYFTPHAKKNARTNQ